MSIKPLLFKQLSTENPPTESIKTIQKQVKAMSRIEFLFENKWLQSQSFDCQQELLKFLIQNNMCLKAVDGKIISKLLLHMAEKESESPLIEQIMYRMYSLTPLVHEMVDLVSEIEDGEAVDCFCKIMKHMCDVSLHRLKEDATYVSSRTHTHFTFWSDLFSKCKNETLFKKMCKIHSESLRFVNSNRALYRLRIIRRLLNVMFVELFHDGLCAEHYYKADMIFEIYTKQVRTPLLNYVELCDETTLQKLVSHCPSIASYLSNNQYKLDGLMVRRPELKQMLSSAGAPLLAANSLSGAHTSTSLLETISKIGSTDELYHNLNLLSCAKQREVMHTMLNLSLASSSSCDGLSDTFMQKHMRYVLRIVSNHEFEKAVGWFSKRAPTDELSTVLCGMALSISTQHEKRQLAVENIKQIRMQIITDILKKLATSLIKENKGASTARKKNSTERIMQMCNKKAKIVMDLPLDCQLSESNIDTLLTSIHQIQKHTHSSLLLLHYSTKALRHLMVYVLFTIVLTQSVKGGSGDLHTCGETCAICAEKIEPTDSACQLPCSHSMHTDCMCAMIQQNKKLISKDAFCCPYCNSDIVENYRSKVIQNSEGQAEKSTKNTSDTQDIQDTHDTTANNTKEMNIATLVHFVNSYY